MSYTNLSEDRGPSLVAAFCACLGLICIALGIRFWSRALLSGRKFWWDDWTALACLPFFVTLTGLCLKWQQIGLGKRAAVIPPEQLLQGLEYLYAGLLLNNVLLTLPKYSALLFYARAFRVGTQRRLRIALWTVGILTTGWFISAQVSGVLQCIPPAKAWNPQIKGHCLNMPRYYFGGILTNVLMDLLVLVVPVPTLLRLHMNWRKKLLLVGVFILGYSVVGVSIGRLITILVLGNALNTDFSWNAVPIFYFSAIEPCVSIVCICLPATFHLVNRSREQGLSSLFTLKRSQPDPLVVTPRKNPAGQENDSIQSPQKSGDTRLRELSTGGSSPTVTLLDPVDQA